MTGARTSIGAHPPRERRIWSEAVVSELKSGIEPHRVGEGPRRCLKCGRIFPSKGAFHRICRHCKRVRGPDDPDDPEAESSRDGEVSREQRERLLRALMGLPLAGRGRNQVLGGTASRFRTCQWILGEPSADEACKCGSTTLSGSAYCHPRLTTRVLISLDKNWSRRSPLGHKNGALGRGSTPPGQGEMKGKV